jgi:nitrile hydratase subunit beta
LNVFDDDRKLAPNPIVGEDPPLEVHLADVRKLGTSVGRLESVVYADGEIPPFQKGDLVRVLDRSPIGHYRVPIYLRGKIGTVEAVIKPPGVNNEDEGFGRNVGSKRHYYRIALPMKDMWTDYRGSHRDSLRIEVFETWLERI